MRRVLCCRALSGLLDTASGVTKLGGDLLSVPGIPHPCAPFCAAGQSPFRSQGSVVAESARISAANAAGLRKTIAAPFCLGIGTPGDMAWLEFPELEEWVPLDTVCKPGQLYAAFHDLILNYDVAQIDKDLDKRQIELCIELEVSTADE